MSFQTEMEARFGAENIKQWTNQGPNTNTTSVNTTVLATALTDVEGDFRTIAGVEYDSTDNRMLGIACNGASCYLRMRGTSHGGYKDLWDKYKEALASLRKVTNANRLIPAKKQLNSYVNISPEASFADSRRLSRLGYNTLNDPPPTLPAENP